MKHLQKYSELAALTRQNLIMDCLWHWQCAEIYLTGQDREQALEYIRQVMKNCPGVPLSALTGKLTHRIWYLMFRSVPELTVWVRKKIGIGV